MKRIITLVAGLLVGTAALGVAGEIGFVEDFALAPDRTVPLKQLIPGTEDYYYYHCLHLQNTEQFDKVDELLQAWIKRHNYTQRVHEILNRQALLTYHTQPAKSLEYIRSQLGIQFNHQRETIGKPNLPTVLDQKLISRETLSQRAMSRHTNLEGFEDAALDWLVATELSPDRRRHLLSRLDRPDYPNLPKLVVDDLNYQYSGGFGSLGIHGQLLLAQLEECLKLKPDLLNQANFVNTYITKLHPSDDVDWRHDAAAHEAYLDRLWSFVQRLAPVHNSLKAHVLYHRLVLDRSRGIYDKERLMTYIALPRHAGYMNRKYMETEASRRYACDLNADYQGVTLLPPVGDDEPLVRDYLQHLFVKETTTAPYEPFLDDIYLKHLFAETKIINGLGEGEQWYSMLPPEKYQALKERIDIDFAFTNKKVLAAEGPVSLDLYLKNVQTLIVKVFEINTQNFYRENLREIDTDINLDGLVANVETTFEYNDPPLLRVSRHFDFPTLSKPGVYVVDFIGNGKSSRALVRKGTLRHLVRTNTAGHVFTVLDEKNQKLADASLWLAGQQYKADKNGLIAVPFSNQPGRQPIVLSHGELSSLSHFVHEHENYSLSAGIYVDREALLAGKRASIIVRPALYLNGTPVTLSVLEDVRLVITSTDHDGVSSTKEVDDFKLYEDRESLYEFQTPPRLSSIAFALHAKVQNLSRNEKVDVAAAESFALNEIDRTEKIEDLHFAEIAGRYVVDLLGKSGEPKPDRAVKFSLKHRDFREPANVTLQTSAQGRVDLGPLAGITSVTATGPEGTSRTWNLLEDEHTYHHSLHGKAGESLELPYMPTPTASGLASGGREPTGAGQPGADQPANAGRSPSRSDLSLLEVRGDTFVADRFDALSIEAGMLRIGKLPAGDYDLLLKDSGTRVRLCLTAGEVREGYVLGDRRQLELRGAHPLQIQSIEPGQNTILVRLQNATKFARVHVFATRYQPAYPTFPLLSRPTDPEPYSITTAKAETVYLAGRNIGDEYRYIIDRKYASKFPGNMLERPSLLLNPWAIRKTETGEQLAELGESFGGMGSSHGGGGMRGESKGQSVAGLSDFSNLDFLTDASVVLTNLVPDENGVVTIGRDLLGPHQHLHVVAVEPQSTTYRTLSLAEQQADVLDLRLLVGLDPKLHYSQQKQITVVGAKQPFLLSDITTARFQAYDSLQRVYGLYATLSHDANLAEFGFILNWHTMKPDEKQAMYSKYACHELTFFVYKKDPEFFRQSVRPYLQYKKDKTLLDRWLLEENLTEFLQPWNYEQLNVVERILLAQRVEDERAYMSRHVTDLYDLVPPNIDRFNDLFNTALQGRVLDTSDDLGLAGAKREAAAFRLKDGRRELDELAKMPAEPGQSPAAPPPAATPSPAEPSSAAVAEKQKELKKSMESLERRAGVAMDDFFESDKDLRANARQLYRKLDKTQEWVENNYYHLPIAQQNANLVTVNAFWRDYAQHDPAQPFYSTNLTEASRNFTEMMFALSLLDLPFASPPTSDGVAGAESAKPQQSAKPQPQIEDAGASKTPTQPHVVKYDGAQMTLTPGSPLVVFHEEIKEAKDAAAQTPILVSQNFFRHGDRYRFVDNERLDKYVTDEFLVHTVYGCQIVVTNPTSSPQKLDVLLQIPVGALPVLNGQATRSAHIDLQPFNTQTVEYYFYFPGDGKYPHYPVHVSKNGELVANAEPVVLNVVKEPSKIDRESWDYISQFGTEADVLAYLKNNNLHRTNLDKIAFRMHDAPFFRTVTDLLAARHVYQHTLWSYGIKHNVPAAVREYLQHADSFVSQCGSYLESPLLVIDPVVRKTYEHMDYRPLVNSRAHQLGRRRQILNDRFFEQYHRLLDILSHRRQLDDDDRMAVTYYMLLQDRIEEALDFFGRVDAAKLTTRMQYDYFTAYLDLLTDDHKLARGIAAKYANHPVDRWRNAFASVTTQLDEIDGAPVNIVDTEDRTQIQTKLAATEPAFDFTVEAKQVVLNYQSLDQVVVNYYLMDIELLFSRNPFVQQYSGQFSYIRPNGTQTVKLPPQDKTMTFELPEQLHNSNVLVEIIGGGQTKQQAYYSHSLAVQTIENYGQLRVTHGQTGQPIPKTYVKVFAQMQDGTTRFYKDGYTDLRGRFDYTSLNTNELDFVQKFSLLILSDTHGATVREASPPKR